MKNWFSRFKRFEIAPGTGIVLLAALLTALSAWSVWTSGVAIWSIAMLVVSVLVSIMAIAGYRAEQRLIATMETTLSSFSRGVLEPRVTNIPANSRLAQSAWYVNESLDQVEAVLREALTVVSRMAQGNFNRYPQATGMLGLFPQILLRVGDAQQRTSRTVDSLRHAMAGMAEGKFDVSVSMSDERGDYKTILENSQKALAVLDSIVGDVASVMDAVAQGRLTQRVNAQAMGSLTKLKDDINRSLTAMAGSMKDIGENAQQVARAASETSTAIGQLADGAQSQTQYIGQVVAAIRQTATSINDISSSTETASKQAQESAEIVRLGQGKMAQMVEVVNGISTNSEKISKITEVIEKIANKTNLLSLNAAIEAARAGEHGKGFAVVAEEVGKLAASSGESAKEITALIQQAVSEASRAVVAVHEVSSDMERIVQSSNMTDSMLQRISTAVEEQGRMVQEINENVSNLDKIAHSNSAASEELAASMIELSRVADSTRREISKFEI